jgi:hypothetical protein
MPTGRSRTSTSPSARRSCPTKSRPTCWPSRASSARWCARASRTACQRHRRRRRPLLRAVRRQRAPPRHAGHAQALLRGAARRVRRRLRGADRHRARRAPLSSVLSFYFRDEVLPYYAGDDEAARDLAANDFKYWELMRRACARGSRSSTTAAASRAPALRLQEELGLRAQPLHYEYRLYKRDSGAAEQPQQRQVQAADRDLAAHADRHGQLAGAVHRAQPGLSEAMANLLYLVHRLPYPPNKGDKVRSYHLLKHLLRGTRSSWAPSSTTPRTSRTSPLRALCAGLHVARLHPRAPASPAWRPARRRALTLRLLPRCRPAALGRRPWRARDRRRRRLLVVDGPVRRRPAGLPMLVDFVDVDSAKWTEYADKHRWPMSWLYRREASSCWPTSARWHAGARAPSSSPTRRPTSSAPGARLRARVEAIGNGVDADYFAPAPTAPRPSPPTSCRWSSPAPWTTGPTSTP